jgi:hypothetical protein
MTIIYKSFEWRRPPMEGNLKKKKMEYLSNHLLDHTQRLNWNLDDHTIFENKIWQPPKEGYTSNGRKPPMEVEYLCNHL